MNNDNDLITRQELADTIGMSKSGIVHKEKRGELKPIIDEHRVHKFRIADVRHLIGDKEVVRLKQAKPYVPSAANASGKLAADIFTRLDRGEGVKEIVKKLEVHPDVVFGIGNTWAKVERGMFVRSRHIVRLAELLGIDPSRDADSFVEEAAHAIGRLRMASRCRSCRKKPAEVCRDCLEHRVKGTPPHTSRRSAGYRPTGDTPAAPDPNGSNAPG